MFTIGNGFCAASVCLQILNSFNISGMDDVIRSSNLANGSSNKPRPVPHCQAQQTSPCAPLSGTTKLASRPTNFKLCSSYLANWSSNKPCSVPHCQAEQTLLHAPLVPHCQMGIDKLRSLILANGSSNKPRPVPH